MIEDEPLTPQVEALWLSPWACSAFVALRDKTLTGTAPVLQHGTTFIAESLAIIEDVEETYAGDAWPRILPGDRRERARARQLLSWFRIGNTALRRERPTERIFYPPATREPLSADVDMAFALERANTGGTDVPAAIAAYADAVWTRPSVHEYVAHARPPDPPLPFGA